jgi:hypothetical protein
MQEIISYAVLLSTPVLTSLFLSSAGFVIYKKSKSLSALCASLAATAFLFLTLFANIGPTDFASTPEGDIQIPSEIASLASELSGIALISAAVAFLVYAWKLKKA